MWLKHSFFLFFFFFFIIKCCILLPSQCVVIMFIIKHPTPIMTEKIAGEEKEEGNVLQVLFYFHTKVGEKHNSLPCLISQAHFPALNQTNRNSEAIQSSLFFGRCTLFLSWWSYSYCLQYTTRCIMAFMQPWIVLWALATYTEQ